MTDPIIEDEASARARRGRNLVLALGLVAFVILIFVVTLIRMGAHVLDRSI